MKGYAPGWRFRCPVCGSTWPAARSGLVRVWAASRGKRMWLSCQTCGKRRWLHLEKEPASP